MSSIPRAGVSVQCPFCGHLENRVIDSRLSKNRVAIRRRRECLSCEKRFTTYERIEEAFPVVIKKDGRREPFDRQKIVTGLKKACEKRPIPTESLEKVVETIERRVLERGDSEVESRVIGEEVMRELHRLDQVAYVRFASVYRDFKDVSQFMEEVRDLLKKGRKRRRQ